MAIVALDAFNASVGIGEELCESRKHIGLEAERECPQVMSKIIKDDKIILKT